MLLLQIAAATDTLIVRSLPPVRTGFEQLVHVASGTLSIVSLLLVTTLLVVLIVARAKAKELGGKIEGLLDEIRPLAGQVSALVEDAREVTANLNAVIDESRETVSVVHDRVRDSAVTLSERVDDLSEIIGRVNDSAERVATIATTTVAGLKFGAGLLGSRAKRKKRRMAAQATEKGPRLRRST